MSLNSHSPMPTPVCAVFEPQVALLSSGMLEGDQVTAVHEHLADCAYCQYQLQEYQRLREDVLRLLLGGEHTTANGRPEPVATQDHRQAHPQDRGAGATDGPMYFTLEEIVRVSEQQPPVDMPRARDQRPPNRSGPKTLLTTLGVIAALLLLALLASSLFGLLRGGPTPATQPSPTVQKAFVPYTAAAPGLPCDANPRASTLWSGDQGTCLQNPAGTRLVAQGHLAAVMRWDASTSSLPGNYKVSVQVTLEGASTAKLEIDNTSGFFARLIECSPNRCDMDGSAGQICACDTSKPVTLAIVVTGRTETFYVGSTLLGSVTESNPLSPDSIGLGVTAAGTSAQGGLAVFANFAVVAV